MSIPRAASAPIDLSRRDLTLDLARVLCVLLVVVIHLLMVGVNVDARLGLSLERTLEAQPWYAQATWVGQIMPLFFVIGGFAGLTAWRSAQRRGEGAATYVKGRMLRLARPTLPLFVFYTVAIATGYLIIDATGALAPFVLDAVFIGAGSPLWFIAAFGLSQALLPLLARLHTVAPKRTVLVLLLGVIAVDAIRYATADLGIVSYWLGLLNLLFVWPLIQQIGFWYADGFFDRAWWQLLLISLVAAGMLWPLTTYGPYDIDMLVNMNPPTLPMVIIGLSQAAFLRMLKRPLTALMRARPAQAAVFFLGTRLVTIYLWHMPVIVAIAGISLLIPGANPRPDSAEWWWSRILVYALVLACVFALSLVVGRWEAPRDAGETPAAPIVVLAVGLTIAVPTILIPLGLDFPLAVAGSITFAAAIVLLGRSGVLLGRRLKLGGGSAEESGPPDLSRTKAARA